MADPKNQDILKKAIFSPQTLTPDEQKNLNKPLKNPSSLEESNRIFFEDFMKKIKDGKINLFSPSSLINQSVYDALPTESKSKIDIDSFNLLSKLREIKNLHDIGQSDSYQMDYMIESVRLIKERIEQLSGDVFII